MLNSTGRGWEECGPAFLLIPERRWQAASAFAQYSIVLIKAQVFGAVDGDDEVVRVFTQGTLM